MSGVQSKITIYTKLLKLLHYFMVRSNHRIMEYSAQPCKHLPVAAIHRKPRSRNVHCMLWGSTSEFRGKNNMETVLQHYHVPAPSTRSVFSYSNSCDCLYKSRGGLTNYNVVLLCNF